MLSKETQYIRDDLQEGFVSFLFCLLCVCAFGVVQLIGLFRVVQRYHRSAA